MSILIHMELPKNCATCPMLEGDKGDGLCHAASRWLDDDEYWTWYVYPEGDLDDSKPCNCPLIELPPHGDLVDRDRILKSDDIETLYDALRYAPPIIPAEPPKGGTDR